VYAVLQCCDSSTSDRSASDCSGSAVAVLVMHTVVIACAPAAADTIMHVLLLRYCAVFNLHLYVYVDAGMDPDEAMKDFLARITAYKKVYEPLKKEEGVSFIRLTNAGEELLTYQCSGYTLGRISWLMGRYGTRL
jgi:6-phosphofructo-2-kinase